MCSCLSNVVTVVDYALYQRHQPAKQETSVATCQSTPPPNTT